MLLLLVTRMVMLITKMVIHQGGYDCLGGGTDKLLLTLMMKVSVILILVDSGFTPTPS